MTVDSEFSRKLFAGRCECFLAASSPEQFPNSKDAPPEIAFVGRSNVGKSSIINALAGRKGLARSSNTPGRTQQIVFFDFSGRLTLVDLPGYGHAKAPKEAVVQWTGLVKSYLRKRSPLRLVCVLIDARRGLMKSDEDMMDMLDEAAVGYQAVLTKIDCVKKTEQENAISGIEKAIKKHPAARTFVLAASAKSGKGIDLLRNLLANMAAD